MFYEDKFMRDYYLNMNDIQKMVLYHRKIIDNLHIYRLINEDIQNFLIENDYLENKQLFQIQRKPRYYEKKFKPSSNQKKIIRLEILKIIYNNFKKGNYSNYSNINISI